MSEDLKRSDATSDEVLNHPAEPLFINYVSALTGRTYDEEMVDHLADMLLIFYAAGGTGLGAIVGGALSLPLVTNHPFGLRSLALIPVVTLVGAILGCLAVMLLLNFRGVVRWDKYEFKRTISLKSK